MDPVPGSRAEIWSRRHEDDQAKSKCRSEFAVAKVRASHAAIDATDAAEIQRLYEILIDYGAHPNQLGVLAAVSRLEDERKVEHLIGILQPDELRVMMSLRLAVAVAVGVLRVFRAMYPERFRLAGLNERIDQLVAGINTAFQRFVRETR
jgi:hypothetical protein